MGEASEAHTSSIQRKPHQLGLKLKTICDRRSGVFLDVDPVEGAEADSNKEFYNNFVATTATTLYLCKRWLGSNKDIVVD